MSREGLTRAAIEKREQETLEEFQRDNAQAAARVAAAMPAPVANVYQLIAAVSGELAKVGISKDRTNTQGSGYRFRGIDDVYNALAPLLAKHGLVILPRMLSREVVERQSKSGGALFYVTVTADFDFVSAHDGSKHTVRMYGEAMDSGDKASNKAMSAAYKYAAFQTFCIPTEGDHDTENVTHEVAAQAPEGFAFWADEIAAVAEEGTAALWAAWKASAEERRNHMMSTNKAGWDKLKAKAAAVTAKADAAAAAVVAS